MTHSLTIPTLSLKGLALAFKALHCGMVQLDLLQECTQSDASAERMILSQSHCLLPRHLIDSESSDFALASIAHATGHLLFSPVARPIKGLKPMGIAVVSAIEDARTECLLVETLPGVREWFRRAMQANTDQSDVNFTSLIHRMSRAILDPNYEDEHFWILKARRLFNEIRQKYGLKYYRGFREIASILANDLGQMRVQFNPQQYVVPEKYRDDHSYLWDYAQEAQSTQAAYVALTNLSDIAQKPHNPKEQEVTTISVSYQYPEWDYKRQIVKADWCVVRERSHNVAIPKINQTVINTPITRINRFQSYELSRNKMLRSQSEGEQIDLNAAIGFLVQRRMGISGDSRYFLRPDRRRRIGSILLLLDLSISTNDILSKERQSLTILDMEKQAAVLFASSALSNGDRVAIHGFSSNSRNEIDYVRLLDFGQAFDNETKDHILALRAQHSTRLGAAMRHASYLINKEISTTDYQIIFVISDGEPSDIDVFDPLYLIEDAVDSVLAAGRKKINCFGFILDKSSEEISRKIFGQNHYQIIDRIETLPRQLQLCCQNVGRRLS